MPVPPETATLVTPDTVPEGANGKSVKGNDLVSPLLEESKPTNTKSSTSGLPLPPGASFIKPADP